MEFRDRSYSGWSYGPRGQFTSRLILLVDRKLSMTFFCGLGGSSAERGRIPSTSSPSSDSRRS